MCTKNERIDPVDPNDIKQQLADYRSTLARYRSARDAYNELLPGHISGASKTGRVQSDSVRDHQEIVDNVVQQRGDLRERLSAELAELCREVSAVIQLINMARTEQERAVLHLRYVEGLTVEGVAERMYCDVRTVYRVTDRAIGSIAAILDIGDLAGYTPSPPPE